MNQANEPDALCPTLLSADFAKRLGILNVPRHIAMKVGACASAIDGCALLLETGHSAIVYGRYHFEPRFFTPDDAERIVAAVRHRSRAVGWRVRAIDLAPCLEWLCRMAAEVDASESN